MKFKFEFINEKKGDQWEKRHSICAIKANTLKGAFKRFRKRFPDGEVYQVFRADAFRCVFDFMNGSGIYGTKGV